MSDNLGAAVFQMAAIAEEYVDHEAFLQAKLVHQSGRVGEQERRRVGADRHNSRNLKQIGEIAKTLEAGLPECAGPRAAWW